MGIFDSDNSEDEVKISPDEGAEDEGLLKDEVETEIVSDSDRDGSRNGNSSSSSGSERGRKIRERSNSNGKSTFGEDSVSLEDVHRQNERIIELLKELNEDNSNKDDGEQEMEGDLNGVL